MVIATQVQTGGEGTYPLTDVQMDRFLLRVFSDYPSVEEEQMILDNIDVIDEHDVQVVASTDDIKSIQELAREVHVSPSVNEYIVSLIDNLRQEPDILSGPSTRASIALYKCARVSALFDGRDFVIPDDVKRLVPSALGHRIRLKTEAEMDNVTPAMILDKILAKVPVPKVT